jgi:hypothetical protein
MIFEKPVDKEYHRWFAWYPVILSSPDEWDRQKRTGGWGRTVWLQYVWRMRSKYNIYYALFDGQEQ